MSVIRTAHESPVVAATAIAATPTTTASTFASVMSRLPRVASIPILPSPVNASVGARRSAAQHRCTCRVRWATSGTRFRS
jgi:hypothetical protein